MRRATALAALLALAACAPQGPKTYRVTIANMAFAPAPPELHVGDVVEFVNADIFEHSATARDGSFDLDLAPKASGRVTMTRAGSVDIYCRFHPGMTGRLAVAP